MLESPQQEDACLQCGGNGQSCHLVKNTFAAHNLPKGYNQMFIIPVGATTISIRETVATRNYLAVKNLRGEYYLNGHWVIEFSRQPPLLGLCCTTREVLRVKTSLKPSLDGARLPNPLLLS
ncbi:papilin-like [Thalassophryne amazonica]|uniref:papilin-like n=1 Tax=Thalassophryne amazonica TaxID=390379 RepID=UPI001470CDAC|nr:papilin-like [Thalassophryne amazonica]